ncbi:MAG: pilus assembly protein [Beijerinckiaceae bacterium]|nr:pilus assembly protein [Beijerinckiaceae bacterium]
MRKMLLRFHADRAGVTAIEFAAVAPIFLGLMLTIIETGIVFGANQMLENAVYTSSRQILTGQLQTYQAGGASAKDTYCKLVSSICSGMSPIMSASSCYSGIQIDTKAHTAGTPFSSTELSIPVKADGSLDTSKLTRSNLGSGKQYMLIRAYYQYPVYVAFLGGGTGATDKGKRLLVGSAALALEPFPGTGADNSAAVATATCTPS